MRKMLLSTAIVLATGFSGAVLADHHGKTGDGHAKKMQYMSEKLELSAEQQTKLKSLHEQHGDKHSKMKKEHRAEVKAILTKDQQAKMAKMHDKKHDKMKMHGKEGKRMHDHGDKVSK